MTAGWGAAIFGCDGLELTAEERAFFREADPLGFILFARNVESPEQLRRLTHDLRDCVGRDALITVDQEGGRVQRLRAPHWHEHLPPLDMVSRARDPMAAMEVRSRLIAAELRAVGIDSNCAPVVDIAGADTHPFLRNRCYGIEVEAVARLARTAAEAHLAGGVLPVMKHMPGHGRATADSHRDLPTVTAPVDELRRTDFAAFRALRDLPMAMTAHIIFTDIDADQPATCSPDVIHLIRTEIGFDGLLMTDDIEMQALSGPVGNRAARAIGAGCDVVLHCNGGHAARVAVAEAVGRMSSDAMARAERALALRKGGSGDPQDLARQLADLIG